MYQLVHIVPCHSSHFVQQALLVAHVTCAREIKSDSAMLCRTIGPSIAGRGGKVRGRVMWL